ncbi:hypothetical protein G6F46_015200 [Rhizopus delemar]|nr:hypothetical protein G6F46_015200 [Rhizopus delemar]
MAPGQRRRLGRSALGGGIVRPGRGDGGQRRAAITGANDARLVRYRRAVDERDRRGAPAWPTCPARRPPHCSSVSIWVPTCRSAARLPPCFG